ncbi:MAG: hypothetical protein P1V51_04365 [Deltaproteobacteria bacterium]|nr:hypothetical protein [Deltaproteobacteria bacterium]
MKYALSSASLGLALVLTLAGCDGCGTGTTYIDGGSGNDSGTTSCVTDSECASGWTCESGVCTEPFFCRSDLDCPAGQTCNLLTGSCGGGTPDGGTDGGGTDGGGTDGGDTDGGVQICNPLEARCSADQLSVEECVADGSAWNVTPCVAPSPVCYSGACVACSPGAATCNGEVAEICRGDGSGYDTLDCAQSGQSCVGGACQLCTPGATQCADATTASTCNPTGTAWVDTACTNGSCDAASGQCLVQTCTPGVRACQGSQLMECNAGGTGLDLVEDCAATGKGCQGDVCVSLCDQAVAQNSYIGCEYWPVVLANSVDARFHSDFAVVVSNPNVSPATVTVNNAAGTQVASTTVAAGQLATINLPWNALDARVAGAGQNEMVPHTAKGAIAYRLVSDVPVTAYQYNPLSSVYAGPCLEGNTPDNPCYSFSNDASLLLPAHVYGDAAASPASTYLSMAMPHAKLHIDLVCVDPIFGNSNWGSADLAQPAFTAIVATAPGTTSVTVNPRGAIATGDGVPVQIGPGQVTTFTLQQYEVLQLASAPSGSPTTVSGQRGPLGSDLDCLFGSYYFFDTHYEWPASDLTGSIITSDKPVAVYGGAECRFMPYGEWACDHMEQQLFPFENWGFEYVGTHSTPTGTSDPGDIWRVVAAADNTVVTFTPPSACSTCSGGQATLSAGQKLEFQTNQDFMVSSPDAAHPFMLVQYFVGQNATGSNVGDPTMILSVPTAQYRNDYAFTTPLTIAQDYVNIVKPTGADVSIDGVLVSPAGGWVPIPGTPWVRGRATVSDGAHRVSATAPIGLTVYGYDEYVSYGYPGGLDLRPIVIITPGG